MVSLRSSGPRAGEQHHGRKRAHVGGHGVGAGQRDAGLLVLKRHVGRLVGKGRLGRLGAVGAGGSGAARAAERERKGAQALLPLAHQLLPIGRAAAGKLRGHGLAQAQVHAVGGGGELHDQAHGVLGRNIERGRARPGGGVGEVGVNSSGPSVPSSRR